MKNPTIPTGNIKKCRIRRCGLFEFWVCPKCKEYGCMSHDLIAKHTCKPSLTPELTIVNKPPAIVKGIVKQPPPEEKECDRLDDFGVPHSHCDTPPQQTWSHTTSGKNRGQLPQQIELSKKTEKLDSKSSNSLKAIKSSEPLDKGMDWEKEYRAFMSKYYGASFECSDFEGMVNNSVKFIAQELAHTREDAQDLANKQLKRAYEKGRDEALCKAIGVLEGMKLNPDTAKRWKSGSPEYREEKEWDHAIDTVISQLSGREK